MTGESRIEGNEGLTEVTSLCTLQPWLWATLCSALVGILTLTGSGSAACSRTMAATCGSGPLSPGGARSSHNWSA